MARKKRDRKKVSAKRRVAEHKVGGGSNYVKRPENMEFFSPKAGKFRLDFMSFHVGAGNPYAEKGTDFYERTFFVHRGVGPNNDWYLCSAKTFGKPCPVCEYRAKESRNPDADEEVLKGLAPSERQLFLVKNLSEPDSGVMLWEHSFHLFGKILDNKIQNADEEDGYDYFADPEEGLTVRISFEQSDRGKWLDCVDIEFKARKSQYTDEDVDEMPCLDDLLVATPYDKLKAIFLQVEEENEDEKESDPEPEDDDDDDDDDDDEPKKESKPKVMTADEKGLKKGSLVIYKGDRCEIFKISGDGTSLALKDEDGEVIKPVGVDDVKVIPLKSRAKKTKPEPDPEPEPEKEKEDPQADDDDPDWDDGWDD